MTEREKMLAGETYYDADPELVQMLARAKAMCEEYNAIPRAEREKRVAFMKGFLGKTGSFLNIESNVWFDYGCHTEVGENFYCNHDCVFLDCAKITFGENVFIGPQCGFYTAGHPLDTAARAAGYEYAKPITVGNNVWFGGGVRVMPGVTVGEGAVIAGGSVVVHDVEPFTLAAGNPARTVKKIV